MKMFFHARLLVFLLVLSTPLAAVSFAQTSIYKAPVSGPSAGTQRVALTYRASFDIAVPVNGEVTVTVPFPAEDEVQHVEKYSFGSAMPPEKLLSVSLQREPIYGNRFWEIRVLSPTIGDELVFEYEISRKEKSNPLDVPVKADAKILVAEKQYSQLNHSASQVKALTAVAAETILPEMSRDEAIKAIYRQTLSLLDTIITDKNMQVGRGGITWSLENRPANSIDLSAVASVLAREANIAAKPEMGVLIPAGKDEGEISEAHAWTNLFHPQRGWIPVDTFEGATKKRYVDYYLGNIGSDHISFAVGDRWGIAPITQKYILSDRSDISPMENVPIKMKISFKRLPNSNPMIAPDQSSGVE